MGSTGTIASLPSLPMELVEEEILCRLPVKKLMQLRCICKSWKSLISDDPKFAKKHLRMSKILKHQHHHLIVNFLRDRKFLFHQYCHKDSTQYPNFNTVRQTQLNIPTSICRNISEICSCYGILCFTLLGRRSAVLCNPSLRKYSTLPSLEYHRKREVKSSSFSFGYDHFNDVYKVIAISCLKDKYKEVDVYTLGTNYWRSIQDFPCSCPMYQPGVSVGGTVNWLAYEEVSNWSFDRFIVSLDLKKESYQKIPQPELEKVYCSLGMFRDCLCIFASSDMFLDVWIMKEYGIKESWTKLYHVPYMEINYGYPKTVYMSDNDQVLFGFEDWTNWKFNLVVYDTKDGKVKISRSQHIDDLIYLKVNAESLISLPCSY